MVTTEQEERVHTTEKDVHYLYLVLSLQYIDSFNQRLHSGSIVEYRQNLGLGR